MNGMSWLINTNNCVTMLFSPNELYCLQFLYVLQMSRVLFPYFVQNYLKHSKKCPSHFKQFVLFVNIGTSNRELCVPCFGKIQNLGIGILWNSYIVSFDTLTICSFVILKLVKCEYFDMRDCEHLENGNLFANCSFRKFQVLKNVEKWKLQNWWVGLVH